MAAPGVYRGRVERLDEGRPVVAVPQLGVGIQFGPLASSVHGLGIGDGVIVASLGLNATSLHIIGRTDGRPTEAADVPGLPERLAAIDERAADIEAVNTLQGQAIVSAAQSAADAAAAASGAASAAAGAQSTADGAASAAGTAQTAAQNAQTAVTTLRQDTAGRVTAKGDVLAGTAAGVLARRAVGANGLALTADSADSTGLAYAEVRGIPHPGGAGITVPTRWLGTTASGAPTGGPHLVGDWVISRDLGDVWVCTAAGSPGTWVSAAATLRTTLFGGPTRTRAHRFVIRLNQTWGIVPGADRWAVAAHWTVPGTFGDPDGAAVSDGAGPGWRCPISGRRWRIHYKLGADGSGNAYKFSGKVCIGQDINQSVASDVSSFHATQGETYINATRSDGLFVAGQVLRWNAWSNANVNISAALFGVINSELVIADEGPQ